MDVIMIWLVAAVAILVAGMAGGTVFYGLWLQGKALRARREGFTPYNSSKGSDDSKSLCE